MSCQCRYFVLLFAIGFEAQIYALKHKLHELRKKDCFERENEGDDTGTWCDEMAGYGGGGNGCKPTNH